MKCFWLLLALFGTGVSAQSQPVNSLGGGFSLPDRRLQCDLSTVATHTQLECEVAAPTYVHPPRPELCQRNYGATLAVLNTGPASLNCGGNTIFDPSRPVLAASSVWRKGGFICRISRVGVRCINRSGHGFELARARYRLF